MQLVEQESNQIILLRMCRFLSFENLNQVLKFVECETYEMSHRLFVLVCICFNPGYVSEILSFNGFVSGVLIDGVMQNNFLATVTIALISHVKPQIV